MGENLSKFLHGIPRIFQPPPAYFCRPAPDKISQFRTYVPLSPAVQVVKNPKTGKTFPLIRPSKKAMAKVKGEIKAWTCRRTLALSTEVVIEKLNEIVRGWVGYFYYGNCSRDLAWIKWFLEERVRIFLRQKHGLKSRGYRAYPYRHLYETLQLYKIPTTAPWTAKAAGRR